MYRTLLTSVTFFRQSGVISIFRNIGYKSLEMEGLEVSKKSNYETRDKLSDHAT